jgi:four helix bundle protein
MTPDELKLRSKHFALRVIKLVAALPRSIEGRAIANQLVRCGTSVAANYRAACRARSKIEFVAKMGVVLEEPDEAQLWLELIIEANWSLRSAFNLCLTRQANWLRSLSHHANLPCPI